MSNENTKADEIKHLTTPLRFEGSKAFDNSGKIICCTETLYDVRYIIEPREGILSDDEILQYAPQSRAASKVRLNRGLGDLSDILLLHESLPQILGLFYIILICISVIVIYRANKLLMLFLLVLYIIPVIYLYTIFNTKKYIPKEEKTVMKNKSNKTINYNNDNSLESLNSYKKEVNNLKVLFDVKEDVVRGLIKKRFEPPQITYDKFINLVDTSKKLFNIQVDSALNIIDLAVEDTPRIRSEIDKKINLMKLIIDEIENLTNELVININEDDTTQQEVEDLLDDMGKLIDSVKDYWGDNITKNCPNCGKAISDDAKFCMDCGHEFSKNNNFLANGKIFLVIIAIVIVLGLIVIATTGNGDTNQNNVVLIIKDVSGYSNDDKSYTLYTDVIFSHVPSDFSGLNLKTTYYDSSNKEIGQEIETLKSAYYDSDYPISIGHYTTYQKPNPSYVVVELVKDREVQNNFTKDIDTSKIDFLN